MPVNWDSLYAQRLEWMTTSVIRDIFKNIGASDTISLAGGWPEADLFPVEQFQEVCQHVLSEMPRESLQYGVTDGLPALREILAGQMTQQGIPAGAENVIITSGSMQALDLMGRIFVDEGDAVLVERPSFLGALQAFKAYGARFVTAPLDDDGLITDGLEEVLARERPKFMYLLPTFHNPAGVTMSLERRKALVEMADRQGVIILEDDPYGQLRFAGEPLPSLTQLDLERFTENTSQNRYIKGNSVYLSTFSKTLAPGLRVAWAVCPEEIAQQFVMAKQGTDLHTNALAQTMAYEFLRRGWLPAQVQRIRDTYLERRNAMCDAIAEFFPAGVHYTRPEGGLFLWVTLPPEYGVDTTELLMAAAQTKVAFVPGAPFYANGGGSNTLRLSFASVPPQTIREGIRRLGQALRQNM